jgi:hypothetical protein
MSKCESVALPVAKDGRPYITAEMACEYPHLRQMIERQTNFWRQDDPRLDVWFGPAPEALHP